MYRKVMKRWLSGMLLFALVLGLGAPASANLLYTAQTYYSNTKLGKIVGDTATVLSPVTSGDWGQGIFPFKDAQNRNRVAVTLYQGRADTIKILNPASVSWNSPVAAPSGHSLSNINSFLSVWTRPVCPEPKPLIRFPQRNARSSGTGSGTLYKKYNNGVVENEYK